jgi:coproporphyrinogen III oxidase
MNRGEIEGWYRSLQSSFAAAIEDFDEDAAFESDSWSRPGGGGGDTRVLSAGRKIEKAAVNFSAVWGATPEGFTERVGASSDTFYATGISIIVHPTNPHAPTFHANLRYFESNSAEGGAGSAWFGGGADLTPYYLYQDDAAHFHRVLRAACERHDVADHRAWKEACDRYFYLPHRKEARGIGGIFFDHLTDGLDEAWAFQRDLGSQLVEAYLPILERRAVIEYGETERRWHDIRRGRYVEFNLVWDRGTKFGLDTGGRTESILGSMPPRARWDYGHEPDPASPEGELLELLRGEPLTWE